MCGRERGVDLGGRDGVNGCEGGEVDVVIIKKSVTLMCLTKQSPMELMIKQEK